VALLLLAAAIGVAGARLVENPHHGSGIGARLHFWQAAWKAFVSDPITGLGPGTYATAYTQFMSVPPNLLYLHAHNKFMLILAESGVFGVLSGAMLLGAIVWAGWRHWLEADVPSRRLLAGVSGALLALVVHSLLDTPTELPSVAILVATLTAILTTRPRPVRTQRHAVWWRLALTSLLLGLLAVGAWSQFAYRPYVDGVVLAELGDWEAAASRLEQAVARDPGHALYSLTSGYVHGVLAERGDGGALAVAIRRYEAAIEREPGYALNRANLAALYRQQGDMAAALSTMEQAVQSAPDEATFWLNLGLYREETGDLAGAQEAYEQVLTLRPWWADAYYWRANSLRLKCLESWRAAHPPEEPSTTAQRGEVALAAAHYEEALQLYDQQLAANPASIAGYLGRAEALTALGRYNEARKAANIVIGSYRF